MRLMTWRALFISPYRCGRGRRGRAARCGTPPAASWTSPSPHSRAVDNQHSNRDRSVTYRQGDCSYRRAEEEEEDEEEEEEEEQ